MEPQGVITITVPPIDLAEMTRTGEGDLPPTARRWGEMVLRGLEFFSSPTA